MVQVQRRVSTQSDLCVSSFNAFGYVSQIREGAFSILGIILTHQNLWICRAYWSPTKLWITSKCSRLQTYVRYVQFLTYVVLRTLNQRSKHVGLHQMLVVEHKLENNEDLPSTSRSFNINDFIWPHGITPPLKHVRKRRFRQRISRAVSSPENRMKDPH